MASRVISIRHRLTSRLTDLNQAAASVIHVVGSTAIVSHALAQIIRGVGEPDRLTVKVIDLHQAIERIIIERVCLPVSQLMARLIIIQIVAQAFVSAVRPGFADLAVQCIVIKSRLVTISIGSG